MISVNCSVSDYSLPTLKERIVISSCGDAHGLVEIKIGDETRRVDAKEIISAIERAELGILGR